MKNKRVIIVILILILPILALWNFKKCEIMSFLSRSYGKEFNDYRKANEIPLIENSFKAYYENENNSNDWRSNSNGIHKRKLVNVDCGLLLSEVDYYEVDSMVLIQITVYPKDVEQTNKLQFEYYVEVNGNKKNLSKKEFQELLKNKLNESTV